MIPLHFFLSFFKATFLNFMEQRDTVLQLLESVGQGDDTLLGNVKNDAIFEALLDVRRGEQSADERPQLLPALGSSRVDVSDMGRSVRLRLVTFQLEFQQIATAVTVLQMLPRSQAPVAVS